MWIVKAANGERLLNITSDKVLKLFRTARDRILNIYCVIELKFYLISVTNHEWIVRTASDRVLNITRTARDARSGILFILLLLILLLVFFFFFFYITDIIF